MASEILSNDSMISAQNVTPWHGLGTVFDGTPTAVEALKLAKLEWTVEQESVFDGDMATVDGWKINRRSDDRTVLGVVPATWTPLQNDRLLEIAEALAQVDGTEYKPVIETAGSLRGGRIVWAMVRTNERTFADSAHRSYLLLTNGHDGKRAIRGTLTDTRVVCANTLRIAERSEGALFITHTTNVEQRIAAAITALGWANEATTSTFAIYEALAAVKLTPDKAIGFFADLFPDKEEQPSAPRIVGEMFDLYRNGKGNEGKTAFDALNAVTDWVDHSRGFRDDGGNVAERRFLFANLGGEGDQMKRSAYRNAMELIEA